MEAPGLELVVDYESQVASLRLSESRRATIQTPDQLSDELETSYIRHGVDPSAIRAAFSALQAGETTETTFVIARGKAVRHGQDGRIDFKVSVGNGPRYLGEKAADEYGRIDYLAATTISSVAIGDLVAEVLTPVEGEDGIDLAGEIIKADTPEPTTLVAKEGVAVDETRHYYTAASPGRPVFSKGELTIRPVLEVSGDVSLTTGNIRFDGHVAVRGSVSDGVEVEAQSLQVYGSVGAAIVKVHEDFRVSAGVNGNDEARIEVGGNATARYINGAHITVEGDLDVSRQIFGSIVHCRGRVTAGRLAGGECIALAGIIVGDLGTELGVYSLSAPGEDYSARRLDAVLENLDGQIDDLIRPIEPLFGNRRRYLELSADRQREIRTAYTEFVRLEALHNALREQRAAVLARTAKHRIAEIVVRNAVFADAEVRTRRCRTVYRERAHGPLLLVEDVTHGVIKGRTYQAGTAAVELGGA